MSVTKVNPPPSPPIQKVPKLSFTEKCIKMESTFQRYQRLKEQGFGELPPPLDPLQYLCDLDPSSSGSSSDQEEEEEEEK